MLLIPLPSLLLLHTERDRPETRAVAAVALEGLNDRMVAGATLAYQTAVGGAAIAVLFGLAPWEAVALLLGFGGTLLSMGVGALLEPLRRRQRATAVAYGGDPAQLALSDPVWAAAKIRWWLVALAFASLAGEVVVGGLLAVTALRHLFARISSAFVADISEQITSTPTAVRPARSMTP